MPSARVRPDRVGEALVAAEHRDGALALTAVDRGRANAALTVLTRLGAAGNEEPLWRLIDERRSAVAEVVLEVAQETGDPAGRVMAESLERRPDPVLCTRLEALLPVRTVALLELGVVVTVGADIIRGSRDEEHADQAREAHRKNNLGNRFSALGRREEALAAAFDAVRALSVPFLRHPPAFEEWMSTMVRNYIARCQELRREADHSPTQRFSFSWLGSGRIESVASADHTSAARGPPRRQGRQECSGAAGLSHHPRRSGKHPTPDRRAALVSMGHGRT